MANSIHYAAKSVYTLTRNFGKTKLTIAGISNVAIASLSRFLQPDSILLLLLLLFFVVCLFLCIYNLFKHRKKEAVTRQTHVKNIPAPPDNIDIWTKDGVPVATIGLLATLVILSLQFFLFKEDSVTAARKKIAELGLSWSGKDFLENVKSGDAKIVGLFIKGQMDVTTATSEGRTLPVMIARNDKNPEEILKIVLKSGFDINYVFNQPGGMGGDKKITILAWAIQEGNLKLTEALIANKADINKEFETFGSFGISLPSFPLSASIYWEKPDITDLLIKAGADISKDDYASYRLAHKKQNTYYWKNNPERMQKILQGITPPSNLLKKINTQLRIEEIDIELTNAAKKSFMAYSNPYERDRQEKIIQDLQLEQQQLKELLKSL